MALFREPTRRDRLTGLGCVGSYLAFVVVGALLLGGLRWPVGFAVWLFLTFAGMVVLVCWNARHSGYRCRHCGHEFAVSVLTEFASPHGPGNGGWTYLRCPRCDRRSRARVLARG